MTSTTHYVEIDLLRDGVQLHCREFLPAADYYVHISRIDIRHKGSVWPIDMRQRLPVIGIPLKSEDPDEMIDLQMILNTAYDRAGYDLRVDYKEEPFPPFSEKDRLWAQAILKSKGLR